MTQLCCLPARLYPQAKLCGMGSGFVAAEQPKDSWQTELLCCREAAIRPVGTGSISQLSLHSLAINLVQKTGTFFAASPQLIDPKKRQISFGKFSLAVLVLLWQPRCSMGWKT